MKPLSKIKKILVLTVAVLILLIGIGILTYNVAVAEMGYLHSAMCSTMTTVSNRYDRAECINKTSAGIEKDIASVAEYIVEVTLKEAPDGQTALDILKKRQPDTDVKDSQIVGHNSTFAGLSDNFGYFLANTSDRKIIEAGNAALYGTCIPDNLGVSRNGIDKNCRSKNETYDYGFADLSIGKAYCLTCEKDGYLFGLYFGYPEILSDILNEMVTPAIVTAGMFIVILVSFFILWRNADGMDCEWIRLFRSKNYYEKTRTRLISSLILFSMIVTFIFNTHYLELSVYSMQNVLSSKNLEILSENIEACEKDKKTFTGLIENYTKEIGYTLSDMFVINSDLCSHEQLKEFADRCYIKEISVYDREGILVTSSGDYCGYELTKNEKDPAFAVRSVLTDDKEYAFVDYGDGSGRFLMAIKRKDAPGAICLKYENEKVGDMLKLYSKEEAIRNTDFGNATTYFVKLDEGSTYVIRPYSTTISASGIKLPEELEQDNYSGLVELNGVKSYVNSKTGPGILIVSAAPCNDLDDMMGISIISILIVFGLLMLLLLFVSAQGVKECEPDNSEEEPDSSENKASLFANDFFRTMIKYEFLVLIIGYAFMLFKKTAGSQTMLEFIMEGKWDKGINLFSINASIIVAVTTFVILFLIKSLLTFIGSSIGARGKTVSSIAISFIQFLGLFFIILHTLYQFGVNTTALVASAGIAGLVIGIAAKDIFGDLIAGLFLIFEGNIKVGDFIRFKDFRGEVSEIGARVTVIKRYHRKLIVNNSDLKQYYRLSDEPGSAWVEIDVAADEDIDRIRMIIEDSAEWYQSRIPTLKKGPLFLNVSHFDSSGITICLCGICTDERSSSTKRKLLLSTIELFRENGIKLGMNTMKLVQQAPQE